MPLFFLPPAAITPPTISITGQVLTHVRDSLRMKAGDRLLVGDGAGRRYEAEVTTVTKAAVTAQILDCMLQPPSRQPSLMLAQALLKGEKMDWVIQKSTELGVASIVPLQTRHAVVQPRPDRVEAQTARWHRIALEAAQQSEQWTVPAVMGPQPVLRYVGTHSGSLCLMLTERREQSANLREITLPSSPSARITLMVGPEGGWAPEELAEAEQAGVVPITLGPKILRAETASIIAIGILQHRLGALG